MTNRNFDEWLSKFRPSISSYDYYIDFAKVVRNVDEIKVELNILNSLIASKNIEEEFEKIVTKYPETLQCVPLLLAVRGHEIYAQDEEGAFLYNFKKMNYSVEQYKVFMRKTGLFDMIANHLVNNLVDYALGIETGLDSNGRKNRGGHQMEDLVEKYIVAAGFKKNENYFKEMYLKDIESKWNIDLSALSNQGKAAKRFDFVIKTDKMIYGIETNFYGGGGLLGTCHDLVGLGAGILQVLLILGLHGLSFLPQLLGVRDLAVCLGLAVGNDFLDRIQQELFKDQHLDHQVADLGQKGPAIQGDQCLVHLFHKRLLSFGFQSKTLMPGTS